MTALQDNIACRAPRPQVKKELSGLEEQLAPLQVQYNCERDRLEEIRKLQSKREQIVINIDLAEQRGDLARIADLKYGALPEVDARLQEMRASAPKQNAMLTEAVGGAAGAVVVVGGVWGGSLQPCKSWR